MQDKLGEANKPISETDVVKIRSNLNQCHDLALSVLNKATELHPEIEKEKTEGVIGANGVGPEFVQFTADIRRVLRRALEVLQQFG